eukprot:Skav225285  [mRNA]  locus=scaffold4099:277113:277385:- [translate_table: standard]
MLHRLTDLTALFGYLGLRIAIRILQMLIPNETIWFGTEQLKGRSKTYELRYRSHDEVYVVYMTCFLRAKRRQRTARSGLLEILEACVAAR